MGSDKAASDWGGVRAIDRVFAVAAAASADPIFSVGVRDYGLPFVPDIHPYGGPVGGILTGAAALRAAGCERALVLAVDAPTIRLADLAPLLACPGAGAAFEGLYLPMAVALSALTAMLPPDSPIRALIDQAGLVRLTCPEAARARLRGANAPREREALLRAMDAP